MTIPYATVNIPDVQSKNAVCRHLHAYFKSKINIFVRLLSAVFRGNDIDMATKRDIHQILGHHMYL